MCRSPFRVVGVAALAICLLPPVAALAAGDANTSHCGNEAMAGFKVTLPDCRAYEMVTPSFKDGGVVSNGGPVSVDGTRVAASANGAFGGTGDALVFTTYYGFQRGAGGWMTAPLSPPAAAFPSALTPGGVPGPLTASADLSSSLWSATTSAAFGAEEAFYVESPAGGPLALVGPEQPPPSTGGHYHHAAQFMGASTDLKHVLVNILPPSISERERGLNQPWPGDTTVPATSSLYEYTGTGNTEPLLVGVSNQERLNGKPHVNEGAHLISQCGTTLGGPQQGGHTDTYNAVASGGGTVFFTSLKGPCSEGAVGPAVTELYARVGASRTVAISEPSLAIPGRSCMGLCLEDQNEENGHMRSEGDFAGASEDGSRVFFTTLQPLVNADNNSGLDLYEAQLTGPSVTRLTQVSHDPHGAEAAEVQGVVRVAENGSRVYFVAKGLLTEGKNAEGYEPEKGAYNLYVYNTESAKTTFVATLLTAADESVIEGEEEAEQKQIGQEAERIEEPFLLRAAEAGAKAEEAESKGEQARALEEREREGRLTSEGQALGRAFRAETEGTRGPTGTLRQDKLVWDTRDARPAQATPDGRFLVFVTSAHLTGPEDTSKVAQLFEYDAQTERLVRVSVGHDGYNANGNTARGAYAPHIGEPGYSGGALATAAATGLALSNDGSRVFFESRDSLTPQAVVGAESVYEYHGGNVYLISDGRATTTAEGEPSVKLVGTDGSGQDVFFTTAEALLPQDGDTQIDIYDAREGGGFPASPSPAPCSGDACHGSLSTPPVLPSLGGSAAIPGGGNLTPVVVTPRPPTRAQLLEKALKGCRAKPRQKRRSCELQARRRYRTPPRVGRSRRRGH
jgi:hypothetical protein